LNDFGYCPTNRSGKLREIWGPAQNYFAHKVIFDLDKISYDASILIVGLMKFKRMEVP